MAQDRHSIWVDWEVPSLLPQGYLIEWSLNLHSYNYSNESWRIESDGNATGILLEGEAGLGRRDGLRSLSRGSWTLPIEAVFHPFLKPYTWKVLPPL